VEEDEFMEVSLDDIESLLLLIKVSNVHMLLLVLAPPIL